MCGPLRVGDFRLPEHSPGVQSARDRPGLCGGATGVVRRIAVEDFTYCAHGLILQRVAHPLQQSFRCFWIAVHAMHSEAEGSEQPAPDGPLLFRRERAVGQAHRKDLVWPDSINAIWTIDHVIQAFAVRAYEPREAALAGHLDGREGR